MPQTVQELAAYFDHTILKPEATREDVERVCREAIEHGFVGVCVNPCHVPYVAERLQGKGVLTVTVVGFPLGANSSQIKSQEAHLAISEGAEEIDMVINVGAYLGGDGVVVRRDIEAVVNAAAGIPVKVILETGFLSKTQIKELTRWSAEAGAAFVKTSTGFGPRGASVEDVLAMREVLDEMGSATKIKASGGIRDWAFTRELIAAGASRIGASASVKILEDFAKSRG